MHLASRKEVGIAAVIAPPNRGRSDVADAVGSGMGIMGLIPVFDETLLTSDANFKTFPTSVEYNTYIKKGEESCGVKSEVPANSVVAKAKFRGKFNTESAI